MLTGVACPSTTQCTAVDFGGGEVTFDPRSGIPNSTPHTVDSGRILTGVACPSTTQCTAVDQGGGEVTFDSRSTTPNSTTHTVDSGQSLSGVACPSTTQCTAVDGSGDEVTFDPTSGTPNTTVHTVDSGQILLGVACPSTAQCTAVDFGGGEVTFNPRSTTPNSTPRHIAGANSLTGVSCVSVSECVAVDKVGNGFLGLNAASPALSVSAPAGGTAGRAIAARSISAALSKGASPAGTITFRVFGPESTAPTSCTSGGRTVGTRRVSGNGTYHPLADFIPARAGYYWWFARYGGDAGNKPAGSRCGASMRKTVVVRS